VVINALGPGDEEGIYTVDRSGVARLVADSNTWIPPALEETFLDGGSGFGPAPSIDGETVVFVGYGRVVASGMYISSNGQIEKIVDTNDRIDGKKIKSFLADPRSRPTELASCGAIAFDLTFVDETVGMFMARRR
jgi:hypothetical protein